MQALAEGAYAVLHKPLDMTLFFRTIDEARKGGRGGFILVADDDEALCENLTDILGEAGYQVVVAHNGEEVVKIAEAHIFDVLLLDMKLPLLNGLEVYRCIKPIQPNIVTIVITGYAQEMADLIQEILDETAQTCLTKPLDMAQLLGLLKEISAASGD
jgi:CheY-like chemotaxis protein